jgi:hypothetical protein
VTRPNEMAPFHIALGGMRAPRAWASSSTLGIAILAVVADMSRRTRRRFDAPSPGLTPSVASE